MARRGGPVCWTLRDQRLCQRCNLHHALPGARHLALECTWIYLTLYTTRSIIHSWQMRRPDVLGCLNSIDLESSMRMQPMVRHRISYYVDKLQK